MLRPPVYVPAASGLKITEIVQLAPGFTVVTQLLVWENPPPTVMLEIFSEALPVLVSMVLWALLVPTVTAGNVSEVGDKLTEGPVPVPDKATIWVLPVTASLLSVIVIAPGRAPVSVGVKITPMMQLLPAATEPPQLLVSE